MGLEHNTAGGILIPKTGTHPRTDKTNLLLVHKFIGDHITQTSDLAIKLFENDSISEDAIVEDITKVIDKLIGDYPGGASVILKHLTLYATVAKHITMITAMQDISDRMQQRSNVRSIEAALKEMLGF